MSALQSQGRLAVDHARVVQAADLAGTTLRSVSLAESGQACGLALYGEIAHVLGLELLVRAWDGAPSWANSEVIAADVHKAGELDR